MKRNVKRAIREMCDKTKDIRNGTYKNYSETKNEELYKIVRNVKR